MLIPESITGADYISIFMPYVTFIQPGALAPSSQYASLLASARYAAKRLLSFSDFDYFSRDFHGITPAVAPDYTFHGLPTAMPARTRKAFVDAQRSMLYRFGRHAPAASRELESVITKYRVAMPCYHFSFCRPPLISTGAIMHFSPPISHTADAFASPTPTPPPISLMTELFSTCNAQIITASISYMQRAAKTKIESDERCRGYLIIEDRYQKIAAEWKRVEEVAASLRRVV